MCPVCVFRRANTKEDIVPQWARRRFANFGHYPGGLPSELVPMCSTCNGDFASNFENDAAPLMGPMVAGEPIGSGVHALLTPSQQEVIGRWVIKTLLLTYLARSDGPADKLEVTRQILCDMKIRKTPPAQSLVRIGTINPRPHQIGRASCRERV